MTAALLTYLLRDPQSRSLGEVQTEIAQLLHYASFYTPSKSVEDFTKADQSPSADEEWFNKSMSFLNETLRVLQVFKVETLRMPIASLPWLQSWDPRRLVEPLRYILQISEFCGLQFDESISHEFFNGLALNLPSKLLPDPSLPFPLSSYLQIVDYNIRCECSPMEMAQITNNVRTLGNTILCQCIISHQPHTKIDESLRVNLTIFFALIKQQKPITQQDLPSYRSTDIQKQDQDIVNLLNKFQALWQRKVDKVTPRSLFIFDDQRNRKEILSKGSRLSTLYQMIFDKDDQTAVSLQDIHLNKQFVRKTCILFVAMYDMCDTDTERGTVLTVLSVIPLLSNWNETSSGRI